ncbi:helix-turn-helix transcriptional regulator [Alkalihalophilus pseudofirmus]|uniref:helix-turn-helix domain-containing protein n=1 Tax=Alkalihalophilus pseudofirmus TaxID=79885 RepID=UPI00259B4B8C|nr:helix-turn-helix transcriptional regulator [Alkalihalophilus pseudofirmus]WEG16680.1 helix-turn-helix transcriptional regulator [Alkalihalophilus pseudofirmus]
MQKSPELNRRLGRMIRLIRQEKGMTLEKLAEKSLITPKHLSSIERGKTSLSVVNLLLIEKGLGMKKPGGIYTGDLIELYEHLYEYVHDLDQADK